MGGRIAGVEGVWEAAEEGGVDSGWWWLEMAGEKGRGVRRKRRGEEGWDLLTAKMSWGARLDGGWRVRASPPAEARSCAWMELGVGRRKKAEGGMGAG